MDTEKDYIVRNGGQFSSPKPEAKWDVIQIRVDPSFKEEIFNYTNRHRGFSVSGITRLLWAKLIDDEKTMHDPRHLQPIAHAAETVQAYIPGMNPAYYKQY